MKMNETDVVFWDFDGVILNSNSVRDLGFERVLSEYPRNQVEELLAFHRENGGLSRYVKFRHFFEAIRGEEVGDDDIRLFANRFSEIMKKLLNDKSLLFDETLDIAKEVKGKVNQFITSGSDQNELRFLAKQLEISSLFDGIYGSPVPKTSHIANLIENNQYNAKKCLIVGDSINDYQAAVDNEIGFVSFNSPELEKFDTISWVDLKLKLLC